MADPAAPTPSEQPGPLTDAFKLPPHWSGRLTHIALLALVSIACAFVLSPGLYSGQIPELTEQDVGKPFRSTSAYGFRAVK